VQLKADASDWEGVKRRVELELERGEMGEEADICQGSERFGFVREIPVNENFAFCLTTNGQSDKLLGSRDRVEKIVNEG